MASTPPPLPVNPPSARGNRLPRWLIPAIALLVGFGFVLARPYFKRKLPPRPAEDPAAKYAQARTAFSTPADAAAVAEIAELFQRFDAALDRGDPGAVGDLFDIQRLGAEMERIGVFDKMSAREQSQFIGGMEKGMGALFTTNAPIYKALRRDIRKVAQAETGDEVVIYVKDIKANGGTTKFRWWARKERGRWRFYDLEDLDGGMRISTLMSVMVSSSGKNAPPPWLASLSSMRDVNVLLAKNDFDGAEAALSRLRQVVGLPKPFLALRHGLEATMAIRRERLTEALEHCDHAEALQPDIPMVYFLRGLAYNRLQRYPDATVSLQRYLDTLGADALAYEELGLAWFRLNKNDEAAEAFRKGLDDEKDSSGNLIGLFLALPVEKRGEVGERLAKSARPNVIFADLAAFPEIEKSRPDFTMVLAAYRKLRPNDPIDVPVK